MARSRKEPVTAELEIFDWTEDGFGLAEYKNKQGHCSPVGVPFTLPGDVVQLALLGKRKGRYASKLQEVKYPSTDRVLPACKHFGACGGCRWQHLSYEMQLERKQAWVEEEFSSLLQSHSLTVSPIVSCKPPWRYRNKMEFSFSEDRAGEQYLGLMMHEGKGRVLSLSECHLVNSWFMDALSAVKNWWQRSDLKAYHLYRDTGSLRMLTLREGKRTGDRLVMLTVSGNPDYAVSRELLDTLVLALRKALEKSMERGTLSIFLRIHQIKKGEPTKFYEWKLHGEEFLREHLKVHGKTYHFNVSPTAFFQPNTLQAEVFYALALNLVDLQAEDLVYDLYCGTGTLGILAASKVRQVIGIELSPESSLDGRENVKENGIQNMDVLTGDVGKTLEDLRKKEDFLPPDVVMVDPPRCGLDAKAMKHILGLSPQKILYISCNPATQAPNVEEFVKKGYVLKALQPVDQFPHTLHLENIAVLVRAR